MNFSFSPSRISLGSAPKYVDALPSGDAERFSESCERLPWDRVRLNESLEDLRDIRIRTLRGRPANCMLCAMRDDGEGRSVLIVRGQPAKHGTPDKMETYFVSLTGRWNVEVWDTLTGEIRPLETTCGEMLDMIIP